MAGDWIKLRTNLHADPAVIRIGAVLGLDSFAVVGRLAAVWAWADAHTEDGSVTGITQAWIDTLTQCSGFGAAMVAVGWLKCDGNLVMFPHFDRHMGENAKKRATESVRKRTYRNKAVSRKRPKVVPQVVPQMSQTCPTENGTREEKRREEKKEESSGASAPVPAPTKAPKAKPPPKQRQPNPLFDALAEATGSDRVVSGSHIGKLAALLGKADPPYTPEEVYEFARRYRELCSYAADLNRSRPTLGEVEKNIGLLRAAKPRLYHERGTGPPPDFDNQPPLRPLSEAS